MDDLPNGAGRDAHGRRAAERPLPLVQGSLPADPELRRAALYALLHRGNPGDAAFYVDACLGAARVLELACGTGRILRALADVVPAPLVGLDSDPAMLALAEAWMPSSHRGRVELVRADMRTFRLDGVFDRILVPYNGLYALPSDRDVIACLRNAARHLTPGGRVLFDVYPGGGEEPGQEEPDFCYVTTAVLGGRRIEVFERELPHRCKRTFAMEYRYDVHDHDGGEPETSIQRIRHHYLLPDKLAGVLRASGLRLMRLSGDFRGGDYGPESDAMVVEAMVVEARAGGFRRRAACAA